MASYPLLARIVADADRVGNPMRFPRPDCLLTGANFV